MSACDVLREGEKENGDEGKIKRRVWRGIY